MTEYGLHREKQIPPLRCGMTNRKAKASATTRAEATPGLKPHCFLGVYCGTEVPPLQGQGNGNGKGKGKNKQRQKL
jgi:hypothetical protein